METLNFSKKDTNVAKGLLIMMMLMHHLFYDYETFQGFEINFAPMTSHQVIVLIQSFKYVMACFTFITYYGMSAKMRSLGKEEGRAQMLPITIKRYVTLVMSFLPVYVLSLILTVAMGENLVTIYTSGEHSFFGYAIIDALGLANFFATPTLNVTWWYLSLAFIIIFMFPFFYRLYETFGFLLVMGALVLPVAMGWNTTYLGICIGTLAFGIFCEDKKVLEKVKAIGQGKGMAKLLKLVICAALFALLCKLPYVVPTSNFIFMLGSFFICYFCFEFLAEIPILSHIFAFIGKHSMNIFLIHTFIYYYYFKEFTYSFGYWLLIEAVLLGISLLASVFIEALKQVLGYNKIMKWVASKVDNFSRS